MRKSKDYSYNSLIYNYLLPPPRTIAEVEEIVIFVAILVISTCKITDIHSVFQRLFWKRYLNGLA